MKSIYKWLMGLLSSLAVLGAAMFYPAAAFAQTPGTPGNLTAKPGVNKGEVVLTWTPSTDTHRYSLVYGLSSGSYMFGATSVDGGPVPTYTVTHLAPGTRYFFQVWSFNTDDGPATPSQEVSIVAP